MMIYAFNVLAISIRSDVPEDNAFSTFCSVVILPPCDHSNTGTVGSRPGKCDL